MQPASCEIQNNQRSSKAVKNLAICGVLLLSAISASWMLSEKTLTKHECFVSITAREILASGNWVIPTCNGQPRVQKTPLSYWLVAGLAKVTGQVDELTSRLPSAVFAFLSAAAIVYFLNRLLSLRIAVLSAAVWATSLGYIRYSHDARAEMALTFFILLCFLSFYSAVITKSRKRQIVYMLVFWTSFGLANLAKGPAPLVYVPVPLFLYVALFRQWKKIPKLLPVLGVIIFLAIVLPWPLAIAHKLNWDMTVWKREFVDRFLGTYRPGDKPSYYYLYTMFQFIIPWVAFLPIALTAPFYRVWEKRQPVMQFLWLWFVVDLVLITICGGKRQHYIMPLMPAMAILISILIEDMVFVRKAYTAKQAKNILRNHIIVIIAGALAGPIYIARTHPQILTEIVILSIIMLIVSVAVAILFARRQAAIGCTAAFGGVVIIAMISCLFFLGQLDHDRYSRDFSRRAAEIVPQSSKLVAYEYIPMTAVHYFGRAIPVVADKLQLYKHYQAGDWVIATAEYLEKLLGDGRFRTVYYEQEAEYRDKIVAGALMHKTAAEVKYNK
jgi:4-amino-4-deoxy-L-arabinose transferase-like glycosyltransferase